MAVKVNEIDVSNREKNPELTAAVRIIFDEIRRLDRLSPGVVWLEATLNNSTHTLEVAGMKASSWAGVITIKRPYRLIIRGAVSSGSDGTAVRYTAAILEKLGFGSANAIFSQISEPTVEPKTWLSIHTIVRPR